jgi:hypothetical protein
MPFDPTNFPYEPPRPPPPRRPATGNPALFGCPICGELRVNPYQLAHEKMGVLLPADCTLHSCGICSDARVVAEDRRP